MLLCCLAVPADAQVSDRIEADRPGLADASSVIGKRTVQLETGIQTESHRDARVSFVPTLLRIGVADRFEARVEGNTFTTVSTGAVRESGLAPTSLGLKFAVQAGDESKPGVGVIGRVVPESGTNGFESAHVAGDVRLAIDWDLAEHLSLNPNAGVAWSDGPDRVFATGLFAVTLAYSRRPEVTWFVDTSVQQHEVAGGIASIIIDGGIAYVPGRNWQLDISAGTKARGDTPARAFLSAGFAFRTH
ncbi:MAG: transporter [Vicinamibacterales bacterium]